MRRHFTSARVHHGRRCPLRAYAARVSLAGQLHCDARTGGVHHGRRCPLRDHPVAVGLAGRLHCDARTGVVPQNSRRSLRSLRSNSCGKHDFEARGRAPTPALRFSSPQQSPAADSTCREVHRGFASVRTPSMAQQRRARAGRGASLRTPFVIHQRRARAGCGAPLRRREAQGAWPRAQRASSTDSSPLSERSDRGERSESGDAVTRPSIAAQSARSADRRGGAPQPARARLGRTAVRRVPAAPQPAHPRLCSTTVGQGAHWPRRSPSKTTITGHERG